MTIVRRIARPMLASIFITEGVDTLRHPETRVSRAKPFVEKVAKPLRLPNDPVLAVRVNGAVMTVAGTMLAAGKAPRLAATVLSASLAITTFIGHPFWKYRDKEERTAHKDAFARNLVALGGLLHAAVDTAGKPGVGWRLKHRHEVREKVDAKLAKQKDHEKPKKSRN